MTEQERLIATAAKYKELKEMELPSQISASTVAAFVKDAYKAVGGTVSTRPGGYSSVSTDGYIPCPDNERMKHPGKWNDGLWTAGNLICFDEQKISSGDLNRFLEDLTMGYYCSLNGTEIGYTPSLIDKVTELLKGPEITDKSVDV